MAINELVETISGVAQLKEHICVFNVVADLIFDDSGTIYESWTTDQWELSVIFLNNEPIGADG